MNTDEYKFKKGELERKLYNLKSLTETFRVEEVNASVPIMQVIGDLTEDIYQLSQFVLQGNTREQ